MSEGGWGEGKLTARGGRWEGKREEVLSSHRPPHACLFFKLLLVLMQYPAGAYQRRGVSNHFGDSHRVTGYQVKFIYLFIYFLYSLLTT